MQNSLSNLTIASILLLVTSLLVSCGQEIEETTEINVDTVEVKGFKSDPYIEPLPMLTKDSLKVWIDSTNHKKFLSKDGYYDINWGLLADANIASTYFPKYNASGFYAEFGGSPLFLKDKNVKISGYVIPFDTEKDGKPVKKYVLSQGPKSACFFCGNGGPESIMEIFLMPGQRDFRVDEYHQFKGRLVLNNGNPWMLNYLLYDVELVEE